MTARPACRSLLALIATALLVACGGGGGGGNYTPRDADVDCASGGRGGSLCASSYGPTRTISCTSGTCRHCRCVENNLVTQECDAPANIVDPCGANNCCGFR